MLVFILHFRCSLIGNGNDVIIFSVITGTPCLCGIFNLVVAADTEEFAVDIKPSEGEDLVV